MSGKFNPAALMGVESSLDSDSAVVQVSDDELRRIHGQDVRRKSAGVKLAARIVGMAMTERGDMDDAAVLESMQSLLGRMGDLRRAVVEAVGVARSSQDFPAVFNGGTSIALDMLTEEWKWSRLGLEMKPIAPELLAKLLDLAANEGPIFDDAPEVADLDVIRRLCVIETMPKLWNVTNMFDYYQPSREAMVARLARAVSDRAEAYADALCSSNAGPSFARRAIVQRTYATSAGIMCEVYKQAAAKDVSELRSMPELDRAVLLQQYAKIGMKYDHIISRHQTLMERAVDTANLILEAQGEQPRRSAEQGYAAG